MSVEHNFNNAAIMVVGDVMLDRYWWGTVTRISPEAPVPVVRLERSSLAAGGAANVAVNIFGLGCVPVLIGTVGADAEADLIRGALSDAGVSPDFLIEIADRPTTVKTRVVAHGQQVVRVDSELDTPLTADDLERVAGRIKQAMREVDLVVVSDYAKGLLSETVLCSIFASARKSGKSVLVDPKGKDFSKYRGASLLTPNRREAAEACKLDDSKDAVDLAGQRLLSEAEVGAVLITRGEEGMTLFQADEKPLHLDATAREVYDVTGAGDTVIATMAAAIARGISLEAAAKMANTAAGLVVEQVGTTSVTAAELNRALNGHKV